jgi:hypothetical protein
MEYATLHDFLEDERQLELQVKSLTNNVARPIGGTFAVHRSDWADGVMFMCPCMCGIEVRMWDLMTRKRDRRFYCPCGRSYLNITNEGKHIQPIFDPEGARARVAEKIGLTAICEG